ncbi:MAG: DivIVA domain-containing protein [Bifidobacteriaceae bacterium]|jgi:DivIVA domain-containing protein|nr:DivIVA domain-containing protein [Bifidobacteriaceae bacterium]
MAQLTADDVVLKAFQTTKFREGYDQVEVDDFLDEVAVSMRAMATENEELKSQLAAAEAKIAELERAPAAAPEAPADLAPQPRANEPTATPEPTYGLPGGGGAASSGGAGPSSDPFSGPGDLYGQGPGGGLYGQSSSSAPAGSSSGSDGGLGANPSGLGGSSLGSPSGSGNDTETATGMLALANKLHEEYVRAGQEEGEQMIAEAKTQAAAIVRDAEQAAVRSRARLEQERADLEKEIESLRIFERDYRTRLRTYLKNLLTDIDGSAGPGAPDALGDR